jgi:tetratricopeptide (TPR) repeat protein
VFVAAAAPLAQETNPTAVDLVAQADSYAKRGMKRQAAEALSIAIELSGADAPAAVKAELYSRKGLILRSEGRFTDSLATFDQGIQISRSAGRDDLVHELTNDKGLTLVSQHDYSSAIAAFESSRRYAKTAHDDALFVTATVNVARAKLDSSSEAGVETLLADASAVAGRLPVKPERLMRLLEIGELYIAYARSFGLSNSLREAAYSALKGGLKLARQLENDRLVAYALGYLGALYELDGRSTEALDLTRQAVFVAQSHRDHESLYRWEWQIARVLLARGDKARAINAYRQALTTLDSIRTQLIANPATNYAQDVRPLYFEFADVLLSESKSLRDPGAIRTNLLEVRATLEKSKVAELVDYFSDQCVVSEQDAVDLDRLASTAAILYPVLLPDRIEILASLPGGLRQFRVPVSASELENEIRKFRLRLQSYDASQDYLAPAQRLYSWLVGPLESELSGEEIDTLVIVPDGGLRTIPLSALHDGNQYLIEKYAIATTLGLSLTSARPIPRENVNILASGITESVQGKASTRSSTSRRMASLTATTASPFCLPTTTN